MAQSGVRLKKWELGVAKLFPAGARVLDVGYGMGTEAFALNEMGFKVTGIDISREIIGRVSAENTSGMRFMPYDGHHFPFDAESFDAVIIWSQTFGLLYGDEYKREILGECRRVLAGDGMLSFSGHDREYLNDAYPQFVNGGKFYPYADTELYWETFISEEMAAYAREAGFKVELCGRGEVYTPEDGVILHCLCER